jgi:hypothetical protein
LEGRETLLPSKSPGSAAGSFGRAGLVASYSIVDFLGKGGGGHYECTVGEYRK